MSVTNDSYFVRLQNGAPKTKTSDSTGEKKACGPLLIANSDIKKADGRRAFATAEGWRAQAFTDEYSSD